ncbi:MAG: IPT/TIG domain-containing protein [bacterium]
MRVKCGSRGQRLAASVAMVCAIAVATGCAPSVDSVEPNPAAAGATVTIHGANLGVEGDGNTFTVLYDGAPLTVVSRSATEIVAQLPDPKPVGTYDLIVKVGVLASPSFGHTIYTAPEPWENASAKADAFQLFYSERVRRVVRSHNRYLLIDDAVPAMTLGATFVARHGDDWEIEAHPKDNNEIGQSAFNAWQAYKVFRTRELALTLMRMFEGMVIGGSASGHPGITSREWQPGWTLTIDGAGGGTVSRTHDGHEVDPGESFSPALESEIASAFFGDGRFTYRVDPTETYFTAEPLFAMGSYALTFVFSGLPSFLRVSDCCSSFMVSQLGTYAGYFWGNHDSRDNFPDHAIGYLAARECAADTTVDANLRGSCARAAAVGAQVGDAVVGHGYNLMTVGETTPYDQLIVAGAVRPDGSTEDQDLGSMNSCQMSYMAKALSSAGLRSPVEIVQVPGSYDLLLLEIIFDLLGLPPPAIVPSCAHLDDAYFGLSWGDLLRLEVNGTPVFDVLDDLLTADANAWLPIFHQLVDALEQPERSTRVLVYYARQTENASVDAAARATLDQIAEVHRRVARAILDWASGAGGNPGEASWASRQLYQAAMVALPFGVGGASYAVGDFGPGLQDAQAYEGVLARGDSAPWSLLTDAQIQANIDAELAGAHPWNQDRYRARFPDGPPLRRAGDHYEAVGADGQFHAVPNVSHQVFGGVDLLREAPLCALAPEALDCSWAVLGCARPDLDASHTVNGADAALFQAAWAIYGPPVSTPCSAGNAWCGGADLERNGTLDGDDQAFIAAAQGCWY